MERIRAHTRFWGALGEWPRFEAAANNPPKLQWQQDLKHCFHRQVLRELCPKNTVAWFYVWLSMWHQVFWRSHSRLKKKFATVWPRPLRWPAVLSPVRARSKIKVFVRIRALLSRGGCCKPFWSDKFGWKNVPVNLCHWKFGATEGLKRANQWEDAKRSFSPREISPLPTSTFKSCTFLTWLARRQLLRLSRICLRFPAVAARFYKGFESASGFHTFQ